MERLYCGRDGGGGRRPTRVARGLETAGWRQTAAGAWALLLRIRRRPPAPAHCIISSYMGFFGSSLSLFFTNILHPSPSAHASPYPDWPAPPISWTLACYLKAVKEQKTLSRPGWPSICPPATTFFFFLFTFIWNFHIHSHHIWYQDLNSNPAQITLDMTLCWPFHFHGPDISLSSPKSVLDTNEEFMDVGLRKGF